MKSTSGIRRMSKQSHDIESNHVTSSTDKTSNGTSNNNNNNSSISGIDSFLHRLDNDIDLNKKKNLRKSSDLGDATIPNSNSKQKKPTTTTTSLLKRIIMSILTVLVLGLLYDTITSPPDKRLLGTHRIHTFLLWVELHPGTGAAAFILVYGMCVVFLLPGTPLTLGGGYVYKVAYGWIGGVFMATFTSMGGSLFGSCSCFLLGRYIMRDKVRKWGRKYPLFDSIDIAVSDNGFKIMCLLYLTPILPLGPVSYMCGTTSMPLINFAAAKIAALPLMLLYVFIGASTDTFFSAGDRNQSEDGSGGAAAVRKMGVDEETHRKMVLFGLILSIVSMSLVSHVVKKELFKIFDKQKKEKGNEGNYPRCDSSNNVEENVEMVGQKDKLIRRPRGNTAERQDSAMQDEEKGCL